MCIILNINMVKLKENCFFNNFYDLTKRVDYKIR